jgi:hypothetical protein
LSSSQLKSLRKLGVTTAEELVAMAAVTSSRKHMAEYMGITVTQLRSLVSKVRKQLKAKTAKDMGRSGKSGHRRGVLDTVPKSKRRGR